MIQKPRGTKDIFGLDAKIYQMIFDSFESLARTYNIKKIITPTFESFELFRDSNGESSDIVTKEIYKFKDYNDRLLALKPEGTASVGRAIIENKLYSDSNYNKLFYIDSMYRYEKPQKGRLRQFYQIGVEFTNNLSDNTIIDVIVLASSLLDKLKINDYVLNINSIGTKEERQLYIDELKKYFTKHQNQLSEMSQKRININPLRILDDKVDSQLDIVKNAPQICDFWSATTKEQFNKILKALDSLKISYQINYSLVRGLDYYSNIVFEFISTSNLLGSKVTVIGGGCYHDLIENDSNIQINGVGFGVGVERLFEIIKHDQKYQFLEESINVNFLIENEEQMQQIRPLIYQLRADDVIVEYNYRFKKFKKLLNDAQKMNSQLIIFQELNQHKTNQWTIKTKANNNIDISFNDLYEKIKTILLKGE